MPAANSFDTTNPGSAVSNRENLANGFYMIAPAETPFTGALKKGPTLNTPQHDWTCDDYGEINPQSVNEGKAATEFTNQGRNRARVFNVISIFEETAGVTDVQQRTNNAAVKDEFVAGIERAMLRLNLKVEAAATGAQARVLSDPRNSAGFANMLSGSSTVFADGAEDYQTPAGHNKSATAPTEKNVNEVLEAMHISGANTTNIQVFTDAKWMSAFTRATTRLIDSPADNKVTINLDGNSYKISQKVSVYQGQHGYIVFRDLNPRCSTPTRAQLDRAIFLDMSMAELHEMKPLNEQPDGNGAGQLAVMKRYPLFVLRNGKAGGYWSSIA